MTKLWGMDYLGCGNSKAYRDVILKHHPMGFAAGFFDEEFGDCTEAVVALLKTNKCPIIRIQLLWGGKSHTYGDKDIPKIISKSKKWQKIQEQFPNKKVWISFGCEHKLQNPDKYHKIVMQHAPSCGIINSPLKSGALTNPVWNEFHGTEKTPRKSKSPILFSFDGTSAVDSDVTTYKKNYGNSEVFFMWIPQFNQHKSMKEEDGKKRDCVPTGWQIESTAYLANARGTTKPPADSIYKSHADQHNAKPEPRAGKPVLIIANKGETITCKAGSQVIATFRRGVVFKENRPGRPKRFIYRIESDYGYKLAQKAIKLTGSPIVALSCGGTLNLGFRDGTYR
jgi:hypothetical protein